MYNHIKQDNICNTTDIAQAPLAHIAGMNQYPLTKIGSKIKFKTNQKIAI
jgi:hypothetical protein